ncbi:MAG TPA: energy transducer TonB [Rhodocyclaceae bacterium]|nr:energy transducer TonB [Rhodocyclaceae bacterium]
MSTATLDARPDRRLGLALAISLLAHSLLLSPVFAPAPVDAGAILRATLRQPSPVEKAAAAETPPTRKTVVPPTRVPLPEPVERTYEKTPAAQAAAPSPAPAEKPADALAAAPPAPQAEGAAVTPTATPAPPPRPRIDVNGLRQYHLALGRMAARFKRYPGQAREAGWEGRVPLRLVVSEAGTPAGLSLIGSSGFPVLDEAALEMMRLAASHTPVPESLRGRAFTIDLAVDYNLAEEQ